MFSINLPSSYHDARRCKDAGTTRRASVPIAAMLAFPMPVQFTAADVRAIAGLAQLELDATQVELFVRQLGDFLAYAHDVLAVNTEGVAPTASMVTRHEADRPDQVQTCLERAAALSNAPEPATEAGFFKVPRVIG